VAVTMQLIAHALSRRDGDARLTLDDYRNVLSPVSA